MTQTLARSAAVQEQVTEDGRANPAEQAVDRLYKQWYNSLTRQLRLSPSTFMLLQPAAILPFTSEELWRYYNTIPPRSLVSNFQVGGYNRFYDQYKKVINQLIPQTGTNFREVLGDYYEAWQSYLAKQVPAPTPSTIAQVFYSWAIMNCPEKANAGRSAYLTLANDPILSAQDRLSLVKPGATPDYGVKIDDVKKYIQRGPAENVTFDSGSESDEVVRTWAKGELNGRLDLGFFSIETHLGDASWEKINHKASTSQVQISLSFQNMITVPAAPGSWYDSGALAIGYHAKDNNRVWQPGSPDWESTFGDEGSMTRLVDSLVVADGINMSVTSKAQYDQNEQSEIRSKMSFGVWPFIGLEAHGGSKSSVTFGANGEATVSVKANVGNPIILGANVIPTSKLLANAPQPTPQTRSAIS